MNKSVFICCNGIFVNFGKGSVKAVHHFHTTTWWSSEVCYFIGVVRDSLLIGKWKHDKQRQKEYFIGLARNKGFHPEKEPHRWTEVSVADISKYNEVNTDMLLFVCI